MCARVPAGARARPTQRSARVSREHRPRPPHGVLCPLRFGPDAPTTALSLSLAQEMRSRLLLLFATAAARVAADAACPIYYHTSKDSGSQRARDAFASFFLTGKGQFWGSAFHVERLIDAVKAAASRTTTGHNNTLLVDVGAAPYNTMGGDISHVLTLAKHWPASTGATIMGFEPGVSPFSRLVEYVEKQIGTKTVSLSKQELSKQDGDEDEHEQAATAGKKGGGGAVSGLLRRTPTSVVRDGSREWIVLRNAPLSDRSRTVKISNQPFAGDNTASLEAHYQAKQSGLSRTVRSLTLDNELRRRGLSQHEILILKVDVEGHEMAVLSGASRAIGEGRVPIILVEYGDKMSPAIWDAMKRFKSAAAAAPTVASMPGPSLFSLMKWGDARGYDSFLLGSSGHKPVLIGLTGALWRDEYEVRNLAARPRSPGISTSNPISPELARVPGVPRQGSEVLAQRQGVEELFGVEPGVVGRVLVRRRPHSPPASQPGAAHVAAAADAAARGSLPQAGERLVPVVDRPAMADGQPLLRAHRRASAAWRGLPHVPHVRRAARAGGRRQGQRQGTRLREPPLEEGGKEPGGRRLARGARLASAPASAQLCRVPERRRERLRERRGLGARCMLGAQPSREADHAAKRAASRRGDF